jgi:hypothetical protein
MTAGRTVVASIEGEFQRYKTLAEAAIEQLADGDLTARSAGGNSVAILVQHIAGNLTSRFTDFLTSDGEKPWRDRETEFADRGAVRAQMLEQWQDGWQTLFGSLASLSDDQLDATVSIRGVSLSVVEALHRSLAHVSYHVGQIVFIGKAARGSEWKYLSIPPGQSTAYNADPKLEKPR